MRLRMLEKEYNQCLKFEIKTENYEYQGLKNVLKKSELEDRLQMISQQDLLDTRLRSEKKED